MKRRSFLLGLTGALAAPAVVRAENLMKIWVPPKPRVITVDFESVEWTSSSFQPKHYVIYDHMAKVWFEGDFA